MRALAIVHQVDAGPGVFADEAHARGWQLDRWLISQEPHPPAAPTTYDAALAFGGEMNANQEDQHPWLRTEKDVLRELIDARVPTMGVCLGSQMLAEAAGAPVERAAIPEIGWYEVELTEAGTQDAVIGGLGSPFSAFQWHSYRSPLPPGAVELASNPMGLQAYKLNGPAWGIQFHAEVAEVDAVHWAVNYSVDPDAVRIGIDPDRLSAEIVDRIGVWNKLGRELCGRFLDAAAA